jgi:hypothetical protein
MKTPDLLPGLAYANTFKMRIDFFSGLFVLEAQSTLHASFIEPGAPHAIHAAMSVRLSFPENDISPMPCRTPLLY